jgi:hypothetical protein
VSFAVITSLALICRSRSVQWKRFGLFESNSRFALDLAQECQLQRMPCVRQSMLRPQASKRRPLARSIARSRTAMVEP